MNIEQRLAEAIQSFSLDALAGPLAAARRRVAGSALRRIAGRMLLYCQQSLRPPRQQMPAEQARR
jgi:hypothetical protein